MPKPIKKRPPRKKPAQEYEVKSAALEAIEKLKTRQRQVIIVASAVLAVVVIYIAFAMYSSSMSSKARSIAEEAYQYYYGNITDETMSAQDRWKKALELYKESVDVKATPAALYYLGNSYFNLQDYDNAIRTYGRFIDTFSGNEQLLPLVYQKLASAYFMNDRDEKALATLAELGKVKGGAFRDTALALEARYYESAGDKEKALETYKQLIAEFPASPWSAEANAKLSAAQTGKPEGPAAETQEGEKTSGAVSQEPPAAPEPDAPPASEE